MASSKGDEAVLREYAYLLANPWLSSPNPKAAAARPSGGTGSADPLSADTVGMLIAQGVISELVGMLLASTPERVLKVVLDGLKEALTKGGGGGGGAGSPVAAALRELGIKGRLETLSEESENMTTSVAASTLLNTLTLE